MKIRTIQMRSSAPALSKFTRLWVISRTCPTSVPLHLLCLPSRRFFWLCTAGFIPAFLSQLTCSHFTGKLHFPWPLPLKWPPTLILIDLQQTIFRKTFKKFYPKASHSFIFEPIHKWLRFYSIMYGLLSRSTHRWRKIMKTKVSQTRMCSSYQTYRSCPL